jgi:gas vesicle protein
MSDKENNAMVGALMLLAGGLLGAGVALLFAPQSGRRTRKDIVRYAKKTRQRTEEMVDDFSDSIADMVEAVGEKASDILHSGQDLAHGAKKELLSAIQEGQAKLEKQRARLAKLVS